MIKSILIKCELTGRGIVNFDSKEQRFTLAKHGIFTGLNENVKLGKKAFTKTGKFKEDGNEIYDYKVKISADCLRHSIFEHDVDVVNGVLIQDPFILGTYMLSPVGLMRGYMFAEKETTLRRKSPLTITDAIQCNNVKSEMEVGSTSGDTVVDEEGNWKRKDTSLFYTEKAGDMKYEFSGQIDIKQLQFMSADPFFDRMGINSDMIDSDEVPVIIANHYGKKAKAEYGVFSSMANFTDVKYGEYGFLFSNDICASVIKKTLKNILSVNIARNNAFAATSRLKIKLVDNIIGAGQKMADNDNWIELTCEDDIDKLNLSNLYNFFEKADEDEVKEREKMIKKYAKSCSEKKEVKAAEKEAKKSRKNATQSK